MDLTSITMNENFKRSGKIKRELSSLAFSDSAVKFVANAKFSEYPAYSINIQSYIGISEEC